MTDKPKLTPAQFRMLDRICKTNGAGVSSYALRGPDTGVVLRLEKMGLVQGKSCEDFKAVHTREGLALWRSMKGAD